MRNNCNNCRRNCCRNNNSCMNNRCCGNFNNGCGFGNAWLIWPLLFLCF
ncbi:hypothetical protein [Clostridium saudiense]|nr:hypothetical protein [Clostridium saudiense]